MEGFWELFSVVISLAFSGSQFGQQSADASIDVIGTRRIRFRPSMPHSEGSPVIQVSIVPCMFSTGSTLAWSPKTTTRSTRANRSGSVP